MFARLRVLRPPRVRYTHSLHAQIQDSLKKYVRWYPHNTVTVANIDTYLALGRDSSHTQNILVGVVYEDEHVRRRSTLLDTLLADPLASGFALWYTDLANRSRAETNLVDAPGSSSADEMLPGAFLRTVETYRVPSPVLSAQLRPEFVLVLGAPKSPPNNVLFLEINKPQDVLKLVDVCHFYVYVTAGLSTLMDAMPGQVQKKILLTVVDNSEYTPRLSEKLPVRFTDSAVTHHVIKVDSAVLLAAIGDFLVHDTQAALAYFDALQASNMLEVAKFVLYYTRTENLRDWVFEMIRTEIAANNLSENQVRKIYDDLRLKSLANFSTEMHAELQKRLIPDTTAFFRTKLPWWMLYVRNDNVEYLVKDYFSAHFMNKSIDGYNYLKGQLVARLHDQKYAAYTAADQLHVRNPLQDFKQDLVNHRVAQELQPVVYSSITAALAYYQLPISALSLVGYLWFGIDGQTAIALTTLGWALGFNYVSSQWHKFTTVWLQDLFEQVRVVISKGCMDDGLLKELNTCYEGAKDLARIRSQVVQVLDGAGKPDDKQE